jgi:3-phenylpropionate/trans-cinnamate dioxygenase ferredoxin reductase component
MGTEIAAMVADLHLEHGVDLRLAASVTAIEHAGGRTTVRLDDGSDVTPDLILIGIGAEPDDQLAAKAGLATDHGVLVDARLRASNPHVYAAGDVAQHDHPLHGRIRVEHWDTAIHHGRHTARAMLGYDQPYVRQPYFFTDQYDLGMEYVGHVGPKGYNEVVIRGSVADRKFTALRIHDNHVVAGMHVNDWDAIDPLRALIGCKATVAVRDTSVALENLPG